MKIPYYMKAVVAAIAAVATALVTGFGDNTLSNQEIVTAILAGVGAGAAVYRVRNKPQP